MKKTPLYDIHVKLGGKIVDFNGWALPVQYSGIIEEHEKVRNAAGLFDVSHMGEIAVRGPRAGEFLQRMLTNDIIPAAEGKAVYSLMCREDGGVVDDLIVYKLSREEFLLVVNAANTEKDFQWLKNHADGGSETEISDVSEEFAQLALQGPESVSILRRLTGFPLEKVKPFHFVPEVDIAGIKAMASRTGYTGEDGFELYVRPECAGRLWEAIMGAGEGKGIVPAGLGARNTLRFEAALPLYGHEISEEITPLEAGLEKFVKQEKAYFIGKESLMRQRERGLERRLAGFEMLDRGVPRSGFGVRAANVRGHEYGSIGQKPEVGGQKSEAGSRKAEVGGRGLEVEEPEPGHGYEDNCGNIGFVTTGGFSPSLKKFIGLAMIQTAYTDIGTEIGIETRSGTLRAKVVEKPFVSKFIKRSAE